MTNYEHRGNKNTWCRGALGSYLMKNNYNIKDSFSCRYADTCRNAHNPSEIKENSDNKKWTIRDKSDIDLLKIFDNIKLVFKRNKNLVKNPKYMSQLEHYESLGFVNLLNLWFDIACYHRKINNHLKYTGPTEGYIKQKDVPTFYIDNEEYIWCFQRTLRMCEHHMEFINYNGTPISLRDICIGSYNCKLGVHNENNIACEDDLINGRCDCISKEEYTEQKSKLETLISIEKTSIKIREYKIQLGKLKRKVHYTEHNMIPLSKRIEILQTKETRHFDESKVSKVKKLKKKVF